MQFANEWTDRNEPIRSGPQHSDCEAMECFPLAREQLFYSVYMLFHTGFLSKC